MKITENPPTELCRRVGYAYITGFCRWKHLLVHWSSPYRSQFLWRIRLIISTLEFTFRSSRFLHTHMIGTFQVSALDYTVSFS